jgi:hypothetical protein
VPGVAVVPTIHHTFTALASSTSTTFDRCAIVSVAIVRNTKRAQTSPSHRG